MQKTQRTFTKEFKLEAVQLVKTSNKPLAQIARDLGLPTVRFTIGVSSLLSRVSKPFPAAVIRRLKKRKSGV